MITSLKTGSNTATLIADALRALIMKGELRGRHPLRQEELAERYGVSKIPVREALFQLQSEGLVEFLPGRGAAVSELTPEDANEIYIMRSALEPVALRAAIPHLKQSDLIQAESALKQIDQENNPTRWGELNWEFHTTLYKPAKLPLLIETLKMWQTNVARYFFVYQEISYNAKSNEEHWRLLDACQRQAVDEACDQLVEHLRSASAKLVDHLNSK